MRLLNTSTLKLESFITPTSQNQYAILSHTWGPEEVVFEDMRGSDDASAGWASKKGASKIVNSCKQALSDGFRFIWIDTCCIDKSSSAELSEAINSMFNWYRRARVCYAYLSDLAWDPAWDASNGLARLQRCRWFGRGWTLQELIAPREMMFFDSSWNRVGTRDHLASQISEITGVDEFLFHYPAWAMDEEGFLDDRVRSVSIAKRMNWAAGRSTTREEDGAYALMGIFNVNMPLLYGEGADKALNRLQEAIIRESGDQSILAHFSKFTLSEKPSLFADNIMQIGRPPRSAMDFTDGSLSIDVQLCPTSHPDLKLAILNCVYNDFLSRPAILLELDRRGQSTLIRYRKARGFPRLWRVRPNGCWPQTTALMNDVVVSHEDVQSAQTTRVSVGLENSHSSWDTEMRIRVPVMTNIAPAVFSHYALYFAEPRRIGNLMLTIERRMARLDGANLSLGLIVLADQAESGVALVWGLRQLDSDLLPWCVMRSLGDLREIGYDALSQEGDTPMSWVEKLYRRAKGTVGEPGWTAFCAGRGPGAVVRRGLVCPLAASITSQTFLGNTLFTLTIKLA